MKKSYVKYILALLLFGSNGLVAGTISLSSYEIVLVRTLIGSVFLLGIFSLAKCRFSFFDHKKQYVFLLLSGAAMGASWMFLYEAYQQIGVSMASLAYYCGPVIVMICSPLLFGERLTWPKLTGFCSVLCGILLVNGNLFQSGRNSWGLICGGLSAVMYAVMVIFNKKAASITGLENSLVQLIAGFLMVAVFVGLKQGFVLQIGKYDWLPVLVLGILNTGIGCWFYFSSIGGLAVQTVAVLGYIEPLSAVILSVLVLKEQMLPQQVLGAVLILGGAVFGEVFFRKKEKPSYVSQGISDSTNAEGIASGDYSDQLFYGKN